MAQLPRLQTPTDKELLLVLEWTAHAQDPSGNQPPPRTQQEIEESIANDEFEDFSDASSMGSAGDIVEVDPDFDTERFLYRSESNAQVSTAAEVSDVFRQPVSLTGTMGYLCPSG